MYKTETHLHVSEVSPCAKLSAEEMIKLYAEAGYTTVFVTDHCKKHYFENYGDIPWNEKVSRFFLGYRNAKAAGEKYGITVLCGAEFAFKTAADHYLAYGITEEFMFEHPDIFDIGVENVYPLAKENGIFMVQAHPFRDGKSNPTPEYVDAIEVYNSNPRHNDNSDKSEQLARELNKPVTAGSDAHRTEDVGLSGVMSEKPVRTPEDYIELVLSGKAVLIGRD